MLAFRGCEALVPEAGLEPAQGYPYRILSPARLPFHHSGTRAPIDNQPLIEIQERRGKSSRQRKAADYRRFLHYRAQKGRASPLVTGRTMFASHAKNTPQTLRRYVQRMSGNKFSYACERTNAIIQNRFCGLALGYQERNPPRRQRSRFDSTELIN